jgi:kinesin family member 5
MEENIKVAVRIRPLIKRERNDEVCVFSSDVFKNELKIANHSFVFDNVLNENTDQETVFNTVVKDAVMWVSEGYNSTIFSYGSTSSGKSYTMFGDEKGGFLDMRDPEGASFGNDTSGIIPRACKTLFETIDKKDEVVEAICRCSFMEIYMENIKDLLCDAPVSLSQVSSEKLRIRQDNHKGVYIQGLTSKFVYSSNDVMNIIKEGAKQRVVASTSLNSVSSRSHAVITLILTQKINDGTEIVSKLHMIDLAGSENVGKSEVQGVNLIEAQTINKSLCSLGIVINALTEKGRVHIPYRDSKLTYLLQDSLGGNSKTIIIATISPASSCLSETLNTLKFAKRAKTIKNKAKINRNVSYDNLLKTIDALNNKIKVLEASLEDAVYTQKAVQVSENPSKEVVVYKTKCERLEKRIVQMEQILLEEDIRTKRMDDMLEKQRELAIEVSKNLYEERIKNNGLLNDLEMYKHVYETITDKTVETGVVGMIIEKLRKEKERVNVEDEGGGERGKEDKV